MQKTYITLFDNKVRYKKEKEIFYCVEDILKYFKENIVHINPLLELIKKSTNAFTYTSIKTSSSINYYVNTQNALRLILFINTKEASIFKEWFIKCSIERINEIIEPSIIYDRLRTLLYKKGVKSNYSFISKEIEELKAKIHYIELDQKIIDEDIKNNNYNMNIINEDRIVVVKLPRNEKTTNIL